VFLFVYTRVVILLYRSVSPNNLQSAFNVIGTYELLILTHLTLWTCYRDKRINKNGSWWHIGYNANSFYCA